LEFSLHARKKELQLPNREALLTGACLSGDPPEAPPALAGFAAGYPAGPLTLSA